MDGEERTLANSLGSLVTAIVAWTVILMASSMAFWLSWNVMAPTIFGLMPIRSIDAFCLLVCVWVVARIAVPKVVMETKAAAWLEGDSQ